MSDSDSDEESFCFYGKALEPYDEDAFPKKRPISVEEQVAKDAQGRRRFHGAFTGGFSAGFFNTVGSLEGWTPAEFKSSRGDKAESKTQRPEDYMDDEDMGEFGIAPQVVRATDEFASKKKRKKQVFSDGPIPGEPVLQTLINSGNETVGYLLLRNMGLKHKEEENREENDDAELTTKGKVYGCEMPRVQEISKPYECAQYPIPNIYKEFLANPKSNTFGLGYTSLHTSHINLFESSNLVIKERNNKKLSISGQAFGVGAFENEDEDIYTKDNMNKYDFELTPESSSKNTPKNYNEKDSVLEIFVRSKQKLLCNDYYPPPNIPSSFTGKHKVRRSRFEPLLEETVNDKPKQLDATIRAKYLGETSEKEHTPSDQQFNTKKLASSSKSSTTDSKNQNKTELEKPATEIPSLGGFGHLIFDKFVPATQDDSQEILEPVKKTEILHGTQEMRGAAALKMFGPLTRITFDWQPCSLLCKRFNVAEPIAGENTSQRNRKRTKQLIFEYQKEPEDSNIHKPGLTTVKRETKEQIVDDSAAVSIVADTITNEQTLTGEETKASEETKTSEETIESPAPIDITERVDVARNTDLFKAIFLSSSSESESEVEEETEDRSAALRNNILTDQLIPKITPTKEGILSNVDFSQFKKPEVLNTVEQSREEQRMEEAVVEMDDSTYGPRVPKVFPTTSGSAAVSVNSESNIEEWVEKDEAEKRKSNGKHKKKHKKEHKKKHKHKHEKKKK